jgi:deoxyribodipyrimidine photo-lyase
MSAVVHWFRRDLRVRDNTALWHAARDGDGVIPVFVLDDHYFPDPAARQRAAGTAGDPNVGPARFRFLRESLEELAASIARLGGRLLLRRGPAAEALPRLLAETGAAAVYANAEIGPYPESRDAAARDALARGGAPLRPLPGCAPGRPGARRDGRRRPVHGLHAVRAPLGL